MPRHVREAIEDRAGEVGPASLKRAAAEMSDAYRAGKTPPRIAGAERTAAYLVTRMPATYAAARAVLRETHRLLGGREISSVLDIGAGSGAAALAALEEYPAAAVTLIDRDRALWQAARVALILIEPGTPRGFAVIRAARSELLAAGAHMIAPCPAEGACPVIDPDWCHFAARVERSALHRRIKGADLGYEDEKYSYVALAREPVAPAASRIVGRPRHHPGLIELETCTPTGLTTVRATKRDRDRFRSARHAEWGAPGI